MLVARIEAPKPPETPRVDHSRLPSTGVLTLQPKEVTRLSTDIPYGWDKGRFLIHMGVVRSNFKVGELVTFSTYIVVPDKIPRQYTIIQFNDQYDKVAWDWSRGVPCCVKIRTVGGAAYDMDVSMSAIRSLTREEAQLVDLSNQPAAGNA